jgi:sialate O-acetylesterase
MPGIFGDHMVLQQGAKLPVWGKAAPGEKVTVTVGKETGHATAAADGKWRVDLEPLKAGSDPLTMTVSSFSKPAAMTEGNRGTEIQEKTVTFSDVLVGDVWICSGQSNMEYGLAGANNAATEVPKANHPLIRLFIVAHRASFEPQDDVPPNPDPKQQLVGHWQLCTPDMVANQGGWKGFSAVAYFFGVEIQAQTHQPIGLIQCPWGGMPVQSFISLDALKNDPQLVPYLQNHDKEAAESPGLKAAWPAALADFNQKKTEWDNQYGNAYKKASDEYTKIVEAARVTQAPVPPKPAPPVPAPKLPDDGSPKPHTPGNIFNGMINPLIPYAIKGAIWYQGEANAGAPAQYRTLFATMITDWRQKWQQGDFPFLFVQLAAFSPGKTWPLLRESQFKTLALPNTGMVTAIDVGELTDIHPKDKLTVGQRLALTAEHVAYGKDLVYSGPVYEKMKVEGKTIRLSFTHVGGGLVIGAPPTLGPGVTAPSETELAGFTIAGADQKFVTATAKIEGNEVVVSSPEVSEPAAVRYAWEAFPSINLYNKEKLPALPFRTDDWDVPLPSKNPPPAPTTASPATQTTTNAVRVTPPPVPAKP